MSPSLDDAPDLSGLIELSRRERLDLKPVILRVQTDLFLSAPVRGRETLAAFAALAGGLIPIVDEETAERIARKLCPHPETPQAILVALAARGGVIRDVVVAEAPVLSAPVLEAALADGGDIGPAIAGRADLSAGMLDTLTGRGQPEVDLALARNDGVALKGLPLARLTARARTKADLARILVARGDLASADLAPLFLFADPERREAIGQAVAATAALRPQPPAPREAGAVLTAFSGRADIAGFVAALTDMLGLPRGFLATVPDPTLRYDLLTLALRAAGLHEEEAVYVFLTLNETVSRSVDRVFDLVRLFRTVPRGAARDLVRAVLDMAPAEAAPGTHQAYLAPDAVRPRAGAATGRPSIRTMLPGRVRKTS